MFRNMVTSLFKYDRIQTTDAKAKELRRWADKLITLAKKGDLHARRLALSIVREKDVVHKLFEEAPERFKAVQGGYTRIVKIGRRPGDAAPVSLIELIATDTKEKKKKSRKKAKAAQPKQTKPKAAPAPAAEAVTEEASETPAAVSEAASEEVSEKTDTEESLSAPETAAESGDAQEESGVEEAGESTDKKEDK
jgi:large subunit ribosomal protein L17